MAVAVRSLAAADDEMSLAQYRVLALLASRGPLRVAELAEAMSVNQSTVTRLCDRLVEKGAVRRMRMHGDRRSVQVRLTPRGHECVAAVKRERRAEVRSILRKMPSQSVSALVPALRAFAEAAGEAPDQNWSFGWNEREPT